MNDRRRLIALKPIQKYEYGEFPNDSLLSTVFYLSKKVTERERAVTYIDRRLSDCLNAPKPESVPQLNRKAQGYRIAAVKK